jgi:hypothetical protein
VRPESSNHWLKSQSAQGCHDEHFVFPFQSVFSPVTLPTPHPQLAALRSNYLILQQTHSRMSLALEPC